jgi:hypothetical protein
MDHPANVINHHWDGLGLNDDIVIVADERDAGNGGNASHVYRATIDGAESLSVQFQHGPRSLDTSTPGVTNEALLAIVIDRLDGFQSGPFACRENAVALTKLQEAMHWLRHRAQVRRNRGVLGTLQK